MPVVTRSKQKLIDAVIEDLKENSFRHDDYTVLDELLSFIPVQNLIQALPEEQWDKYLKLFKLRKEDL